MDKPISVGDLVTVVRGRWCCGHLTGKEGSFFTVTAIGSAHTYEWCRFCGRPDTEPGAKGHSCGLAIDLSSLKRIPPLEELEREKLIEKLGEPA